MPDAGARLENVPRGRGQPIEREHHQVEHVVGDRSALDFCFVPCPAPSIRKKAEQALRMHQVQKAPDEEGITGGFAQDQIGQELQPRAVFAEGVGSELRDGARAQLLQVNRVGLTSGLAQPRQRQRERMGGADLAVAIGADQQQVVAGGVAHPLFEQLQRCCVHPLQVVEEEDQRMLGPGEDAQEPCQQQMEAVPRLHWTDLRNRRLRTEQALELWHQGYQQLPIGRHRLLDALPPSVQGCFRLRQQLAHEAAKRLGQARERNAPLQLIELASGVVTASLADGGAEVVDEG
ncbi:MAG TPA: hypothetical protein VFS67_03845 [Polyangiaceae bacterium]|nr:hypothetical protein [Polyangiaceae bacterium]